MFDVEKDIYIYIYIYPFNMFMYVYSLTIMSPWNDDELYDPNCSEPITNHQ